MLTRNLSGKASKFQVEIGTPFLLTLGDNNAVYDVDKANMLNNFFARCWNSTEPPLTEEMYSTSSSYSSYEEFYVLPEEVLHLIWGLDVKKANGPDGVSAYMLKRQQKVLLTH